MSKDIYEYGTAKQRKGIRDALETLHKKGLLKSLKFSTSEGLSEPDSVTIEPSDLLAMLWELENKKVGKL